MRILPCLIALPFQFRHFILFYLLIINSLRGFERHQSKYNKYNYPRFFFTTLRINKLTKVAIVPLVTLFLRICFSSDAVSLDLVPLSNFLFSIFLYEDRDGSKYPTTQIELILILDEALQFLLRCFAK